jgi:flagellar biosynthetic protein FlhB
MSSEKTEQPTAKKLRDAREKGQVPRSQDLGQAAALLAAIMVLAWTGNGIMRSMATAVKHSLLQMGESPLAGLGPKEVAAIVISNAMTLGIVVGPVALATAIAVVALQLAQGGLVFATDALTPDISRLSPVKGFKRLGFSQSGIDLIKALVGTTVLVVIGWQGIKAILGDSITLARVPALPAAAHGWQSALSLLKKCGIAMLVLAAADYLVQRWRFMKSQRMTKQEVKDEFRLQEGNPEIKGRIRRIQREMYRKRMLAAVPKATLVVTNPTHFAVALQYDRVTMPAPRVVAKGSGHLALKIREIARTSGVPIIENPPLARALHKEAEVGDIIPAALFEAVAEMLAYLIKLKQLVL